MRYVLGIPSTRQRSGASLRGRSSGMCERSGHSWSVRCAAGGVGSTLDRAEKLLSQFITYLEQHDADVITMEHAVAWATLPGGDGWWHAMRLTAVRRFVIHLRNLDDRTQIPPPGLLAHGKQRATSCLYSGSEIDALVAAARRFPAPVAAATYPAMISLLAVTGMRFGEAIALDVSDFDDQTETVIVRNGKFGKSRLLPLHPTAIGLRHYLTQREQLLCTRTLADRSVLFISSVGTRLDHSRAQKTWRTIRAAAGLTPRSANCRPRLHDLRHSFAVATLLDWYRHGADVPALAARAVDLPGPRRPQEHLLVPLGRAGTAGTGRATTRHLPDGG